VESGLIFAYWQLLCRDRDQGRALLDSSLCVKFRLVMPQFHILRNLTRRELLFLLGVALGFEKRDLEVVLISTFVGGEGISALGSSSGLPSCGRRLLVPFLVLFLDLRQFLHHRFFFSFNGFLLSHWEPSLCRDRVSRRGMVAARRLVQRLLASVGGVAFGLMSQVGV